MELCQIKQFLHSKGNHQQNGNLTNRRKYLQIYLYKQRAKKKKKKQYDLKMGTGAEKTFFQRRHTYSQQLLKKCSATLIIREIQIKIKERLPHIC